MLISLLISMLMRVGGGESIAIIIKILINFSDDDFIGAGWFMWDGLLSQVVQKKTISKLQNY